MIPFAKGHGLGNDYLVVRDIDLPAHLTQEAIRLVCDRHYGVGSDGVLVLHPSAIADWCVRIYNPDGSEAEKSGNGIRIAAKYLHDRRLAGQRSAGSFILETKGGLVPVRVHDDQGATTVVAGMGTPRILDATRVHVAGSTLKVVALSIGNPHCVVFVPELAAIDVRALGAEIEADAQFPERTNVQFAEIKDRRSVAVEIWERGAGYTLASGSSACAVFAAARHRGLLDEAASIHMPGGALDISVDADGCIWMRGPVEETFTGQISAQLHWRLVSLLQGTQ